MGCGAQISIVGSTERLKEHVVGGKSLCLCVFLPIVQLSGIMIAFSEVSECRALIAY